MTRAQNIDNQDVTITVMWESWLHDNIPNSLPMWKGPYLEP